MNQQQAGDIEVSCLLGTASSFPVPVTFRAAGTNMSGQAVTDSVLLVLAGGERRGSTARN